MVNCLSVCILSRSAVAVPVVDPSMNIDSFACGCMWKDFS